MRTTDEIADEMATEIKSAMESLESVYSLIPRLLRGKVDKRKERIAELLLEYEQAKEARRPKVKSYGSLRECLCELLLDEDDDLDIGGIMMAKNWPNISSQEEDDREPMDLENYEFLELTDTKLRMCGGGDWQEETTIELELVDGQLTVTKAYEGYENGMDEDEFIKLLKS